MKKPSEAGFSTTPLSRQLNQQLVQTAHIGRRVFQAVAGRQGRLIEEDVRQIAEALVALLAVELLDQWVSRVEFEDRLRIRNLLPAGFQDLTHLQAQVLLADGQDRRGIGQAMGYPYFSNGFAQCSLQTLN